MPIKSIHNEAELLNGIARDDEKSFAELFYGYHQSLGEYVFLVTDSREMAKEIIQNVFIKIWEIRTTLPEIKNFSSWLFITTRNFTLNAIRATVREQHRKKTFQLQLPQEETEPSPDHNYDQFEPIIEQAIAQLPPQQKRVFVLKQQGCKNADIANELGISPQSVIKYQQIAIKAISRFVKAHSELTVIIAIIAVLKK
ncbi:sigma-70 family RNA polymerase sigma factor [Mucilaginibacter sabulilitoris]|uniref:Sigma-70 family RNA polymerase sigma factor n=1 Tax=Mucilaginibacter sabulilitoris TaxID=1173583 RepID=A0ABZ0TM37_9SPHI|nr:sigma-70 family RNA polymerase sigma factor [Mucilaginibacter sabulilitoris]WPU93198.1 sigma-70 family RNA polymerase sigma factor [Mucilaginibacter sabulilitoris]